MAKSFQSISILLVFLISTSVARYSPEYCLEFQCADTDFLWIHERSCTYCCQDCCFITLTSKDKCTEAFCRSTCKRTDGMDEHECTLTKTYEDGEEVRQSLGCAKGEFCSYIGDRKAQLHLNDDYECAPLKKNYELCDSEIECLSGKCSQFSHRKNRCYECIPDWSTTKFYGRERSHHCDET